MEGWSETVNTISNYISSSTSNKNRFFLLQDELQKTAIFVHILEFTSNIILVEYISVSTDSSPQFKIDSIMNTLQYFHANSIPIVTIQCASSLELMYASISLSRYHEYIKRSNIYRHQLIHNLYTKNGRFPSKSKAWKLSYIKRYSDDPVQRMPMKSNRKGVTFVMKSACHVCTRSAVVVCSRCLERMYCSSGCQQFDWNEKHKEECRFVTLIDEDRVHKE